MAFNVQTIALANLYVQILLYIALLGAVYFVKKGKPGRHCTFIRVMVPIQLLAIIVVMLPSLLGYITIKPAGLLIYEILLHHTLGLLVIVLWIYVNLAYGKIIRMPRNFVSVMRMAFVLWTLALIMGVHIYYLIYL